MKLIKYNKEARERLKTGVKILHDAVVSSMGSAGKTAILDNIEGQPIITGDGISISENVDCEQDAFAQMGISLVQNVCREANKVGDGTTAAIAETWAFLKNDELIKDHPFQLVKKGMAQAMQHVLAHLEAHTYKIKNKEELINVATVSARGDKELGKLIADAYDHVGSSGQILVEEGRGVNNSLENITGYQVDKGYYCPLWVNNKKTNSVEYFNPRIIVTDIPLTDINALMKLLEIGLEDDRTLPLVLVAPEISEYCLQMINTNFTNGAITCTFVEAPDFGDKQTNILKDLAYVTGGKLLSSQAGHSLKNISPEFYGTCEKFMASPNISVFINGNKSKEAVQLYTEELPEDADKDFDKKRKSRLTGRLAKLIVGAKSAVEMREKYDRCDDAINAVRGAMETGYVVGGGVALFRASVALRQPEGATEAERAGYSLVIEAIQAPLRQIIYNLYEDSYTNNISRLQKLIILLAGAKPIGKVDEIINSLYYKDYNIGYDVKDMEECNLIEKGIIDPLKVVKSSLEAAYSVASTILGTNCVIAITGENGDIEIK